MTQQRIPLFHSPDQISSTFGRLLALDSRVAGHDGTLAGINALLQQHWRKHDQHQGDIEVTSVVTDETKAVELLTALGILGEVRASSKGPFKYALLYGAYVTAVRKRLALLLKEWEEDDLRFEHLVLLGSQRPRHNEKESNSVLNDASNGIITFRQAHITVSSLATESSIMHATLMQAAVPSEWDAPGFITTVACPLRTEGAKRDPSAAETVQHWLEHHQPEPGSCLGVYSQPGVLHQQEVAGRLLVPKDFSVEMIGYEREAQPNIPACLDTLAKVVYEKTLA